MTQGRFRTLISVLIVLALAGAFLWGGSKLLNSVTGAASLAPTATPPAVVQQPGPTATSRSSGHRATATPRPTHTPPPAPTATPNTPPKVVVALDNLASGAASSFSLGGGPKKLYCLVRNSTLPKGTTSLRIDWSEAGQPAFFQYPSDVQPGSFSYSYAYPANPGKYRCSVTVNGQAQPFATADFTLTQ